MRPQFAISFAGVNNRKRDQKGILSKEKTRDLIRILSASILPWGTRELEAIGAKVLTPRLVTDISACYTSLNVSCW